MSLLSVAHTNAANGPASPVSQANASSVEDQALAAFTQVLGETVNFSTVNSLPSLSGIMHQAQATSSRAPAPSNSSKNNDQSNNNDPSNSGVLQSAPKPASSANDSGNQKSSAATKDTKVKDDPTKDTNSTNDQAQNASDPSNTGAQPVLEMLVGQMTQQPQAVPVEQPKTVALGDQSLSQGDGQANQQQNGPSPDLLAQNQTKSGPQIAGPLGPVAPETASAAKDAQAGTKASDTQFNDLLAAQAGSSQSSTVKTGPKIDLSAKTSAKDTSSIAGQAADLAQSLNGTGANIAVKVAVTEPKPATPEPSAPASTVLQSPFANLNALGNPGGGQSNTANDGGDNAALATQQTASATPTAATAAMNTAATFNAALAAQIEASASSDAAQPQPQPQTQGVQGIGAMSGTQATQKTSQAQAAQTPTPTRQPTPTTVMDQVSVQIDKQVKDGVDTIKVKLNPQELGRIEIKLDVSKDGSVQATVTAENKDTLAMLQKDAPALAKALSDAGLSTDAGSLSFNLQGDQSQQQQFAGDPNGQNGNTANNRRWAQSRAASDLGTLGDPGVGAQRSGGGLAAVDISV